MKPTSLVQPSPQGGGIMTRRENLLRAARRQSHQWITLDFGMSQECLKAFHREVGADVDPADYFNFDGRYWLGPKPTNQPTPDWRRLYYPEGSLPPNAVIEPEFGKATVHVANTDDDQAFFPLRNISTAEEVNAFPWPDFGAAYRYEGLAERVAEAHAAGYPVFVGFVSFFEHFWYLRGFEAMMLDMAEGSSLARRMFERMAELQLRCAEQAARTGADILSTAGDVATQRGPLISPAMWRDYVFPVMRDCIRAAKRINPDILVFYHSCGNVMELMDGFIEAGVDIFNPCQPEAMDIVEMKRRFGKAISFHGGIGVQSILPFGTPAEVKDMVRRTIETMADGGGYLCGASHVVRHDVPARNLIAFAEAVREYGAPPPLPAKRP